MRTQKEILEKAKKLKTPNFRYFINDESDSLEFSPEYLEILSFLTEDKIFRCSCCGKFYSYIDLEDWVCDFENPLEGIICSYCYEDGQGEDL